MKKWLSKRVEYLRRLTVLILLTIGIWFYCYTPSDIYRIERQNFKELYEVKRRLGIIDTNLSLEQYISNEMRGPFPWNLHSQEKKIILLQGKSAEFFANISANCEKRENDYFFRAQALPSNLISRIIPQKADYFMIENPAGHLCYFTLSHAHTFLDNIPHSLRHPLQKYAYISFMIALLIYILLPLPSLPKNAAYYIRFNAVYLPDFLAFSLWSVGLFFFLLDIDMPTFIRYFFLLFFGIYALTIIYHVTGYTYRWYRFKSDIFEYSDRYGIKRIKLNDIITVTPYKKRIPKWIGIIITILGRGDPGTTGIGIFSLFSTPETGIEITTVSGEKIRIMTNFLHADKEFTKRLQELAKSRHYHFEHNLPKK